MRSYQFLIALLLVICCAEACVSPPLAPNYTNEGYSGVWYEIGKIQTPGGAAYQEGCMCQKTTVTSDYPVWGDAAVTYECRKDSPDNTNITSVDGKLIAGETPGNFKQRFVPFGPAADYNIIWLDDETTMEYDCIVKSTGEEEYCVHIMSRTIYIEPTKLQTMIDYAESLGLNPLGIEYVSIPQEGCW